MPKGKKPSKTLPLYATFPTQAEHVNPLTGKVEPEQEDVERLRDWGRQSKL